MTKISLEPSIKNGTRGRDVYILSGGAGTRLWPLSRETYPKQFFALGVSKKPLLVETLSRFHEKFSPAIITNHVLAKATQGILNQFGMHAKLIEEPSACNTAPAVALATLISFRKSADTVLGIFPSDHAILDEENYLKVVERAFAEAAKSDCIYTLGIEPTFPATGYGYIQVKDKPESREASSAPLRPSSPEALLVSVHVQDCLVERFVEKPNLSRAQELLASKKVFWNAGQFVFKASVMVKAFEQYFPSLWQKMLELKDDLSNLGEIYAQLPKISIDYAILEKASNIRCLSTSFRWLDIGSWEEVEKKIESRPQSVEVGGKDNFAFSHPPSAKLYAFLNVSDLIVADTPDALLVMKKGSGQDVKNILAQLQKNKLPQATHHTFEERPWGRFEVLRDEAAFKSKKILVWPKQRLSYQSHTKRTEHWVVVSGSAEVTLEDKIHLLAPGDHIKIPQGAKHRIRNPGTEVLEFIEIQLGTYFGEDDITRYSDDYNRGNS